MRLAFMLATEAHGGTKTLWEPTIVGILVTLSGIFLFCGSAYLLLATNLGARLGFLVSAAALSGFMVLLSTLWLTSSTPLNSPVGRSAEWKVVEVTDGYANAKINAVHTIEQAGTALDPKAATTIRSFLDGAFVTATASAGHEAPEQPFAEYTSAAKYITDDPAQGLKTYETGGGTKNIFWHHPKYAAVQVCDTLEVEVPFGDAPPPPTCDPAKARKIAVLEYDFGSTRLPPACYLIGSLILFLLSMLGLHWYEKDERERAKQAAAAKLSPVTT